MRFLYWLAKKENTWAFLLCYLAVAIVLFIIGSLIVHGRVKW